MTRAVLLAAALSTAFAQMPQGSSEIHGRVLASASNAPLGPALVSLTGMPGLPQRLMAGLDGMFAFRQLPAGRVTLTVTKPGFLDISQPLDIGPGANIADFVVRMQRQAVIAGRLLDDRGTPLVGVEVHALRRAPMGGQSRWLDGPITLSNDRGEYRLTGLAPGDYAILARPDPDPEMPLLVTLLLNTPAFAADVMSGTMSAGSEVPRVDARVRRYPVTLFPSATTLARAAIVTVAGDTEKTKIDLKFKAATFVKVSGTVSGVTDTTPPVTVRLLPGTSERDAISVDAARTLCDEAGHFEFAHVAPGTYVVAADTEVSPAQGLSANRVLSARSTITVPAHDLYGIRVDARAGAAADAPRPPAQRASNAPTTASAPTRVEPAAEISGVVASDDKNARPVRDALVMIAGTDVGVIRVTATDGAGRYRFADLPAGKFLLAAGKPAFISALYGAHRAGRPGTVVSVTRGQRLIGVSLPLLRGGVITGRVLDDAGQPVAGARVRVMQRRLVAGDVALSGDAGEPQGATSDDRGTYRIFDLPPGTYCVGVQPRNIAGGADIRSLAGFVPVYFPGTTNPGEAKTIVIGAGDERAGIDITTKLLPLERIDGVISGAPPSLAPNIQITLRPRATGAVGAPLGQLQTRPGPAGRFTFGGVAPGEYTLFARTLPPPIPPGARPPTDAQPRPSIWWAATTVTVEPGRIAQVSLTMQPPLSIAGRVMFEGTGRKPDVTIRLGLRVMPGSVVPETPEPVTIDANGNFKFENVAPGRYWLYPIVPPGDNVTQIQDWAGRSALVNDRDVFDEPLELSSAPVTGLVVTLTDELQEIIGAVKDVAGRAKRDVTVIAFSADKRYWFPQSRRIAIRQSDSEGQVVFGMAAGFPPGDYYVVAAPDLAPGEQFDSNLLESLIPTATKVTIAAGESKRIELRHRQ